MATKQNTHFIHRLNYSARERLVGIFVLVASGLLLAQLFISGQALQLFAPKRTYVIELKNPVGVSADTKVRVSGLEVGWVDNVNLTERNTFEITLAVYEKFHALIRRDSRASVSKLAVVGDSIINISPGSINQVVLSDGDLLIAEEGMSVDDIMSRLQPVLNQAQTSAVQITKFLEALPTEAMPTIIADLQITIENMKLASQQLNTGNGIAGAILHKPVLTQQLEETIKLSQATIIDAQQAILSVSHNIEQLPALIESTQTLMDSAGTQIQQLPPIMDNTQQLIGTSQDVLNSVSEIWPISNNMPVQNLPSEPLDAIPAN